MYSFVQWDQNVHRLIPSNFPPITLFDWASSVEELEQIAALEGLTNERLQVELGQINRVAKEDWLCGQGSTPVMAAFTHIGFPSRFSDGTHGIYYAASSLDTALKETVFHRERFYKASNEKACAISMREYIAQITKPLIDIRAANYAALLNPDPDAYHASQEFGKKIHEERHWGVYYPSIRNVGASCMAIFRPPALTIPIQGAHFRYIWDGSRISDVYQESKLMDFDQAKY